MVYSFKCRNEILNDALKSDVKSILNSRITSKWEIHMSQKKDFQFSTWF